MNHQIFQASSFRVKPSFHSVAWLLYVGSVDLVWQILLAAIEIQCTLLIVKIQFTFKIVKQILEFIEWISLKPNLMSFIPGVLNTSVAILRTRNKHLCKLIIIFCTFFLSFNPLYGSTVCYCNLLIREYTVFLWNSMMSSYCFWMISIYAKKLYIF